jgi:hypothetical protein
LRAIQFGRQAASISAARFAESTREVKNGNEFSLCLVVNYTAKQSRVF